MAISNPGWKGKDRALEIRQEGNGGSDGIVLPLDLVGSGVYDVAYTIPVKFGQNQQFSLQIDTGSSDLWVASKSCSTPSCSATDGRLYDSSSSRPTGKQFSIPYLQGSSSGPIVWDSVSVGGYTIDNQALAAADDVENEPLTPIFSGVLGLALPLNSIIASDITPVTNNAPDGAAWASNLFSLTPSTLSPSSRFLSLSLSRPGSNRVPALLGIGRHPSELVTNPSSVLYDTLVSEEAGTLFWKVEVRAITVYVNGQARSVDVGRSTTKGGPFPTAVLDSGVPLILTKKSIADAIYGAIGVQPGSDGMYYVPCTTPLNVTFNIDSRPETPIHPLDLTAYPPTENSAQYCIGLIQAADSALGGHAPAPSPQARDTTPIADMILGVPFLRNVYMVMAYADPRAFNATSSPHTSSPDVNPTLGLLALTNSTIALQEFNTVRVLNKPISTGTPDASNTGSNNDTKTINHGVKLSVPVIVIISVFGFFFLCGVLFFGRWLLSRRRWRQNQKRNRKSVIDEGFGSLDKMSALRLARRSSAFAPAVEGFSIEEMRTMRNESRKERRAVSDSTLDSESTRVGYGVGYGSKEVVADEFGYKGPQMESEGQELDVPDDAVWDPRTAIGWGEQTGHHGRSISHSGAHIPLVSDQENTDTISPPTSPKQQRRRPPALSVSDETYTDHPSSPPPISPSSIGSSDNMPRSHHAHTLSVDVPLLLSPTRSQRQRSQSFSGLHEYDYTDNGFTLEHTYPEDVRPDDEGVVVEEEGDDRQDRGAESGMAGVGTVTASSRRHTRNFSFLSLSTTTPTSPTPQPNLHF